MKIKTQDFDVAEIDEKNVIRFVQGILGFEEVTEYVFLCQKDNPALRLQSVCGEKPRFIVFEAGSILADYQPNIPGDVLKALEAESVSELCFFLVAVVPDNIKEMTVNLKSPITVNFNKRLAVQVVLDGAEYPLRYRVFHTGGKVES